MANDVHTTANGERGAALVLALFLVVILTVLGLGLVLRSKVSMSVAGAERPVTKNFYGADGGIQAAYARLQVNNPCPFNYNQRDIRNDYVEHPIAVNVAQSVQIGDPQQMVGSEAGGAISGGGTKLVMERWRLGANTDEAITKTRREVEAEVSVGPTTATITAPCL